MAVLGTYDAAKTMIEKAEKQARVTCDSRVEDAAALPVGEVVPAVVTKDDLVAFAPAAEPPKHDPPPAARGIPDGPALKKAVVDAHKRVGQPALDLLGEYGGKCDNIPAEVRVEFLTKLESLK
jgi:hypothetical protein